MCFDHYSEIKICWAAVSKRTWHYRHNNTEWSTLLNEDICCWLKNKPVKHLMSRIKTVENNFDPWGFSNTKNSDSKTSIDRRQGLFENYSNRSVNVVVTKTTSSNNQKPFQPKPSRTCNVFFFYKMRSSWQRALTSFSIFFKVLPRGPMSKPTKLMFGFTSCGIMTRSLTRCREGLKTTATPSFIRY